MSYGQTRHVVDAVDFFKREAFDQPVRQHGECALAPFLGWLEYKSYRAVEATLCRQQLCGSQEHRGVPIMAAGVHEPEGLRTVESVALLGDAQRVHIGTECDCPVAAA